MIACSPSGRRYRQVIKRLTDVGLSLLLIILASPLLVLVGLLVLCMDGPPMIHRRRVVGPRGEFDAFKFRSMRPDADRLLEQDPELKRAFETSFKLVSDPRVTRLGAFLRRYSLDELPQLFNVLIGQMSLVGPRIVTAAELEKYGEYDRLLLTVKPGLTGYWQVHGRQEVTYAERVRMDVEYILHWCLMLDLKILIRTPSRVISGRGSF